MFCASFLVAQPMPVLPEPVDPQQEQQLQQELAELREQLAQVTAHSRTPAAASSTHALCAGRHV
jgi:hypothetical protein